MMELDSSTKIQKSRSLLFVNLIAAALCICIWKVTQNQSANKSKDFLSSILQNEISSSNSFLLARGLQTVEHTGLIGCVILIDSSSVVHFSTDHKESCVGFFNELKGIDVIANFTSLSGQIWSIRYKAYNPLSFFISIFLSFFLIVVFANCIAVYVINRRNESELIKEQNDKILRLTKQVVHDVASPISVLQTIAKSPDLDEKFRELLQLTTERTKEIIRDLREQKSIDASQRVIELNQCCEKLFKEKKINFPNLIFICIDEDATVVADEAIFQRLLSNLINNAIEASKRESLIELKISKQDSMFIVSVVDQGQGIPSDVLRLIGKKEVSFGKENGSGIGLLHAFQHIEKWSGKIEIQSIVGRGTSIQIFLPACSS